MPDFTASYTCRDVLLYALSLGFGSDEESKEEEMRFLDERHPAFQVVPTFPLVLPFWAGEQEGSFQGMPAFPPPFMKNLLPGRFLRSPRGMADYRKIPVIHVGQSIQWHRPIPIPSREQRSKDKSFVRTALRQSFVSVVPKAAGAFVTTQTNVVFHDAATGSSEPLCTMESTTLLLGFPEDQVVAYQSGRKRKQLTRPGRPQTSPVFEWRYTAPPTQALQYRLSSGDTNRIHVDAEAASQVGGDGKRALLHGLCTLGIAVRGLLRYLPREGDTNVLSYLECSFVKPVFVGDTLVVRIRTADTSHHCNNEHNLHFDIWNDSRAEVSVNGNVIVINIFQKSKSKL
jgi:peroxisomal enoyl-CoA hydratase 2